MSDLRIAKESLVTLAARLKDQGKERYHYRAPFQVVIGGNKQLLLGNS
jgi:hypothetical protein